jgi:hypothetical protein
MNAIGLNDTVAIVRAHVDVGIERTGANLIPLLMRLEALDHRRASTTGRAGLLDLERSVWVRSIQNDLLPDSQAVVATSLRDSRGIGGPTEDPWADLDPEFVAARDTLEARTWAQAEVEALASCSRFVATTKVTFLRTAVAQLERASQNSRMRGTTRRMTIDGSARERDRLRVALDTALSADARAFFVRHVRTCLGGVGPRVDQRLSEERWTVGFSYRLRDIGVVFAPAFQAVYDTAKRDDEDHWAEKDRRREAAAEALRAEMGQRSAGGKRPQRTSSEPPSPLAAPGVPEDARPGQGPPLMGELVLVELPTGPKWLDRASAASCQAEMDRRRRHDAIRKERKDQLRLYHAQIGRPDLD